MRFAFCLAVLVASFATRAAMAAQTAADRIASITSELQAGEFDRALQDLDLELQRAPKSAQLWTLRGLALSGKGDKKEALGAFRKALGVAPDYLPALEGAAQIEYDSGDKDAAVLLQRVLKLVPHDPTSHAMLAVLAYRQGDCAVAIQHFEQSGPLLDSQPGALQEYGACLLRLKQNEKAVATFSRALTQSNGDAGARYRLASVQMLAQHPKDALETLQPLLRKTRSLRRCSNWPRWHRKPVEILPRLYACFAKQLWQTLIRSTSTSTSPTSQSITSRIRSVWI